MIVESIAVLLGLGGIAYGLHRLGYIELPSVPAAKTNVGTYQFDDSLLVDDFTSGFASFERSPVSTLTLTYKGLEFIKAKEGFRSHPYQDSVGVWTIGYGTTKGIHAGTGAVTEAQGEALMWGDINSFHNELVNLVKVPLKQNEYDALMSFIYNLGADNLAKSTLLKKLNAGDYEGAANEFPKWVFAGGKVLDGLVTRRTQEQQTFMV